MIYFEEILNAANQADYYGAIRFAGGEPASTFRPEMDGSITVIAGMGGDRPTWCNEIMQGQFRGDAPVYAEANGIRQDINGVYVEGTDVVLAL